MTPASKWCSPATANWSLWTPKAGNWKKLRSSRRRHLRVDENSDVKPGQILCEWDPHSIPILAEVTGKVHTKT